jgi:hypothetical protein
MYCVILLLNNVVGVVHIIDTLSYAKATAVYRLKEMPNFAFLGNEANHLLDCIQVKLFKNG